MIPRRPRPRSANPEPMIPAPQRSASAALRISYGGCEWCGRATTSARATSCCMCQAREERHRRRMIVLAEREAELRIKVLEQQLAEHTDDPEGPTS